MWKSPIFFLLALSLAFIVWIFFCHIIRYWFSTNTQKKNYTCSTCNYWNECIQRLSHSYKFYMQMFCREWKKKFKGILINTYVADASSTHFHRMKKIYANLHWWREKKKATKAPLVSFFNFIRFWVFFPYELIQLELTLNDKLWTVFHGTCSITLKWK